MSANFSSTERFRVTMVNSDGASERVTVQLSLDGLKILNQDGSRTMRSYNLRNVSSWDLMDTSTVIWTKSDVDLEERALTLSGDSTTIRNVVDTLASCCMQLAEVIRDKEEGKHLEELAAGGGKTRKAAKLPSVDSVEYWRAPDKAGWLQSQSEVMKMWRRRWFVLKQGYLFRFLSPDVSESVKPRGVVDLSKVQDVKDGRSVTGKANTVQLKTASGGSVCYVCESETEMVEWISALEGSISKIVKQLAGIDDSSSDGHHHHSSSSKSSSRGDKERHRSSSSRDRDRSGGSATDWAKQVERSLSHGNSSSSSRRGGSGSAMVSVVNYGGAGGGGGGGGGGLGITHSSGGGGRASAPYHDDYGSISSYNQISGIAGVASAMDDLTLNYGGYPAAGGAAGAGPGGGYGSSGVYGSAPTYGSSGYGSSNGPGGYGAYGGAAGGGSSAYPESSSNSYGYGGAAAPAAAPPAYQSGGYDSQTGAYGAPAANGYGSYAPQQQQQQQPAYGASPGGYDAAAAVGYYQQQQQQQPSPQQQPVQQQPGVSLIDQVPTQQPAYPYYQYPTDQVQQGGGLEAAAAAAPAAAPTPAAPPAPPPAGAGSSVWQVHHTAEGRAYYYNSSTGVTQWEVPPGM